jgi:hypothetical protein
MVDESKIDKIKDQIYLLLEENIYAQQDQIETIFRSKNMANKFLLSK